MGIKQLYNDNLRKLPNEYGDVSVMLYLVRFFTNSRLFASVLFFKTYFALEQNYFVHFFQFSLNQGDFFLCIVAFTILRSICFSKHM